MKFSVKEIIGNLYELNKIQIFLTQQDNTTVDPYKPLHNLLYYRLDNYSSIINYTNSVRMITYVGADLERY